MQRQDDMRLRADAVEVSEVEDVEEIEISSNSQHEFRFADDQSRAGDYIFTSSCEAFTAGFQV